MKSDTSGIGGFKVLTVVLTCLAVQAVFTLPAYGDAIVGWGRDVEGQATPPAENDFTAVAAGHYHSLALRSDGTIVGWGLDTYGQADPPSGNDYVAIAAGGHHSLALKSGGSIVGWGSNSSGKATPPEDNQGFIAIAAGSSHSLALKSDGSIVSWGANSHNQVSDTPTGSNFVGIAAGSFHNLALRSDGSIAAWGEDNGDGRVSDTPTGSNFIAIAAGALHNLALTSNGTIFAWGRDNDGVATAPVGNDYVAIAAGTFQSLALKADGSIAAWGSNSYGLATPPAGDDFTAVAAGEWHSLALVSTNTPPISDAGGPYLASVGQPIVLDGSGSYDEDGDLLSYLWTQADNLGDFTVAGDESPYYTGSQAGITDLTLTVSDDQQNASDTAMLVVYDPSGGFVTGGGWIYSEAGNYVPDLSLEGKANFGFVSKYKKGTEVPTGQTEFVFQAGDLDFHSNSYDWLVVTGSDYARFKGWGSVNGEGGYRFMLWAGDNPDTFRIRIWTEDEITGAEADLYDNGMDQVIAGGSIVIHAK